MGWKIAGIFVLTGLSFVSIAASPSSRPNDTSVYLANYSQIFERLIEVKNRNEQRIDEIKQFQNEIKQKQKANDNLAAELKKMEPGSAEAVAQQDLVDRGKADIDKMNKAEGAKLLQKMCEEFKQIGMKMDDATMRIAKKHNLAVAIPTQPAFPETTDGANPAQMTKIVRAHQIPRAIDAPDLTEDVLDLMNDEYLKTIAVAPTTAAVNADLEPKSEKSSPAAH